MKLPRFLMLLIALLLMPSCATSVAPDGTKTTAPDAPTISLAAGILQWAGNLWVAKAAAENAAVQPTK